MTSRIEELKKIAEQKSASLFAEHSEMWKLANAKRENSAQDYDEVAVQAAHERALDFEIEQAGKVSVMFLSPPEQH